jgi:hypothetical protein
LENRLARLIEEAAKNADVIVEKRDVKKEPSDAWNK